MSPLLQSTVVFQRAKLLKGHQPEARIHAWLDDTYENFGPDLPLLFKMHEIWSVDSQENY